MNAGQDSLEITLRLSSLSLEVSLEHTQCHIMNLPDILITVIGGKEDKEHHEHMDRHVLEYVALVKQQHVPDLLESCAVC